ncbi:hypothetical protein A2Z67_00930 [Candidatus Woesebacteria bacterium RBG_13_36_22]|uniref:Uncharacterized protein n=1 Tax=Candidatus Woesebacteria bacterium RBG_13_36_22 TaxID=1802478 RepID=A0A1F7X0L2_9BACT|nr:MAG: hypothetical protein A2Z67_00930 [Candidatus Woesebacteria bacterium RBG_13_36_22]
MLQIKFSHDWNGKITGENTVFTTIRKSEESKRKYYIESIGKTFEVLLDGAPICHAELIEVYPRWLCQIDIILLMLDTGMLNAEAVYKLFKNFGIKPEDECLVLVFKKGLFI